MAVGVGVVGRGVRISSDNAVGELNGVTVSNINAVSVGSWVKVRVGVGVVSASGVASISPMIVKPPSARA